jgi:hypothetical protein
MGAQKHRISSSSVHKLLHLLLHCSRGSVGSGQTERLGLTPWLHCVLSGMTYMRMQMKWSVTCEPSTTPAHNTCWSLN